MNSALAGFLVLIVLGIAAFQVWLVVIAIRFLRSGRKAFDRYTEMHPPLPSLPVRPASPVQDPPPVRRHGPGTGI